ncbi:MAG: CRISPR-associated RAMP protein Csx7 [Candidatus Sericytochromatia bacterium]
MFKKIYCELIIPITITPEDALLIKSSVATVTGPDSSFVKTYKNGKETPFLPGSSLKGVIRSQAEKIIRTITEKTESCCLPYETKDIPEKSCGERFKSYEKKYKDEKRKVSSHDIYNYSCPACKMFGSTYSKGHFSVSDAYTNETIHGELRDGVAIDRMTGGAVGSAKFNMEVINKGNFEAEIHLRNFESWQLGLLGFILKDINDGILRLGSGTSRGMGRIKIDIKEFKAIYYGKKPDTFTDIGELASNDEIERYGFYTTSNNPKLNLSSMTENPFRTVLNLNSQEQEEVFEWGAKNLGSYLKSSNWQKNITEFTGK